MFVFERQNAQLLHNPSSKMMARQLRLLRVGGRSKYASLMDETGNWVQVGGGGATCLLERKEAQTGQIFRAWHLAQTEWFHISQVIEVFDAFRWGKPFPGFVEWCDITATYPENHWI